MNMNASMIRLRHRKEFVMTKEEMREFENRIRQLEEEPYNPSPERIEAIKQRAFEEYQMYLEIKERKKARKQDRIRRILQFFRGKK